MNIQFGPEHDGIHIDPMRPGAYEWWYFDALSDDGKYALVVIFFLGSPMTPYYKAVVDGKNPLPADWCGVFVTLHELDGGRWKERAYAYNLYRYRENQSGWFHNDPLRIGIGGSELTGIYPPDGSGFPHRWQITLNEPGLWGDRTRATLDFTTVGPPLTHPPLGTDTDPHTWVCVAPVCSVSGEVTLANGQKVSFSGHGYHDHNYGQLPWDDVEVWYWGRCPVSVRHAVCHQGAETDQILNIQYHQIFYYLIYKNRRQQQWFVFDEHGRLTENTKTNGQEVFSKRFSVYGLEYRRGLFFYDLNTEFHHHHQIDVDFQTKEGCLTDGPFYRRLPVSVTYVMHSIESRESGSGIGIGEIFRPARLCHPLWSRLMWTRIRRRG